MHEDKTKQLTSELNQATDIILRAIEERLAPVNIKIDQNMALRYAVCARHNTERELLRDPEYVSLCEAFKELYNTRTDLRGLREGLENFRKTF